MNINFENLKLNFIIYLLLSFISFSFIIANTVDSQSQYNVEIIRDKWGVPHIYGKTDSDVAYGFAYAHCEDDFKTIQDVILQVRGALASEYGKDYAPLDYITQFLRIREMVEKRYDNDLDQKTKEILEAYVSGVNYYASKHPKEAIKSIYPIVPQDIITGFVFRSQFLFGLDYYLDFMFKSDDLESKPDLPIEVWRESAPIGSNTFAISPSRTPEKDTFLLINAHQPWEGPIAWYEVHLNSEEGWNMVGGTLPGSPVVFVGHNENIGWAHTINAPDLVDIYELEINPNNKYQYKYDGEWVDFERFKIPIKVKLFGPIKWTFKKEALWSVHGPVIRLSHGDYAFRYSGIEGEIRQVEQWYKMNKSQNFEEWSDAVSMMAIPSLNCGYADKEGNIFYLYNALFPDRNPKYDWRSYLPGNTSESLWTDYVSMDQLPMIMNPTSGFIQNCNSSPFQTTIGKGNPNIDDYPVSFGIETHLSNRALRALEIFGGDEEITADDFEKYKYDMEYSDKSAIAQYRIEILESDLPEDPAVKEAVDVLKKWDLSTNPENDGAALAILSTKPYLRDYYKKVEQEIIVDNFVKTAKFLKKTFGQIDVAWEKVNRMIRGGIDIGLGGGPDIIHAIYGNMGNDGRLEAFAGDSYVLFVSWDKTGKVQSKSIHQFGSATTVNDSPHFSDQAKMFANRELKEVFFDKERLMKNIERVYSP